MKTNHVGVPQVLTPASDDWDDTEFRLEWEQMVTSWMPTQTQLEALDDITVECWAVCRPLDTREEVFMLDLRRKNLFGLEYGRRQSWWRGWTPSGPWQPRLVKAADYVDRTMSHVMADLKLFPSVGQARKNGWQGPVLAGLHRVGKVWVEIQ